MNSASPRSVQPPPFAASALRLEGLLDRVRTAELSIISAIEIAPGDRQVTLLAAALDNLVEVRQRLEVPTGENHRVSRRTREPLSALIIATDGKGRDVAVHDLSDGGALIESDMFLRSDEAVDLIVPILGEALKAKVRESGDGFARLIFANLSDAQSAQLHNYVERRFAPTVT